MELLYNPDQMSEDEIKKTFVAREELIDEFVSLIKRQPDGAGVQHSVIIAPRGMGKTTVLLMIQFAVMDLGLSDQWQVVRFREESFSITDLAGFWIEILAYLATETADYALLERVETLHREYPNSDDLQAAALAIIKDWRKEHKKRLIVLVENIDLIFEQINDERETAQLREVLMNDGTMMIIGGATTFFHEARDYDQPLYNFFKIYDLYDLKLKHIEELLRRRAEVDQLTNFQQVLADNSSRLRVMEYFTGGNPRLVLMLYHVITNSEISEVKRGLEKLLDEVTPYYKAKVESLPVQQRKILDHIARVSAKTSEGLTPTEIAEGTRLTVNAVTAQLKRLSDTGYLRAANLRERNSYYVLSEPLYAIWHQMRLSRDAKKRMQWLISFLKVWYTSSEIGTESGVLEKRFRDCVSADQKGKARDVLEYQYYLSQAADDPVMQVRTIERAIRGWLQLGDMAPIRELLHGIDLRDLSTEILESLLREKCITPDDLQKTTIDRSSTIDRVVEARTASRLGFAAFVAGQFDNAVVHYDRALELDPNDSNVWHYRANALASLQRFDEALADWTQAISLGCEDRQLWYNRGVVLLKRNRLEDALSSFDRALSKDSGDAASWNNRGATLAKLGRNSEAVESLNRAIEIDPNSELAWFNRGRALSNLGKLEEAVSSFDKVLDLTPKEASVWHMRGFVLWNLKQYRDAVKSYDKALEIRPDSAQAWYDRGVALAALESHDEAIASYDRALSINPDYYEAWYNRGNSLGTIGRYEDALASFDCGLKINPKYSDPWVNRGAALHILRRYDEAVVSFDHALEIDPKDYDALNDRGNSLAAQGRYDEAIVNYDQAIRINVEKSEAWSNRCLAFSHKVRRKAETGNIQNLRDDWKGMLTSSYHLNLEKRLRLISYTLLFLARLSHLELVRELIEESALQEQLFPIARAIDYMLIGDQGLIEKLSPEARGIVEDIITELRKNGVGVKEPETKSRPRKKKSSSRRTKRQL